jgi:hypothetical protein
MSNAPEEEDKHASKPTQMLDYDTEEVKERRKVAAKSPEEDAGRCRSLSRTDPTSLIHREFEQYMRDNKELNMAELSFDTTTPNPPSLLPMSGSRAAAGPEHPAEQHEVALSQFSLGAPPVQQSHDPSPPSEDNVVDRQLGLLLSQLQSVINSKRQVVSG